MECRLEYKRFLIKVAEREPATPSIGNFGGTLGYPSTDKCSRLLVCSFDCDQQRPILRWSNLSNKEWSSTVDNEIAEAQNKPRADTHAEALRSSLKGNADQHDARSNDQGRSSP